MTRYEADRLLSEIKERLLRGEPLNYGLWVRGSGLKETNLYRSGPFELAFRKFTEYPHLKGTRLRDPRKTKQGLLIDLAYIGRLEDQPWGASVNLKNFGTVGETGASEDRFQKAQDRFERFALKAFGIDKVSWRFA